MVIMVADSTVPVITGPPPTVITAAKQFADVTQGHDLFSENGPWIGRTVGAEMCLLVIVEFIYEASTPGTLYYFNFASGWTYVIKIDYIVLLFFSPAPLINVRSYNIYHE
jgi:hypothetical protein